MMREVHIPERDPEGVGYSAPPRRAAVAQVSAMLAGPVLFLLALSLKYGSVPAACRAGSTLRLHVLALLFLVAVLAVAVVCRRAWRRAEHTDAAERVAAGSPDRRRVAVLVGLLLSLLAAFGVLMLWMPILFLDPCRT